MGASDRTPRIKAGRLVFLMLARMVMWQRAAASVACRTGTATLTTE